MKDINYFVNKAIKIYFSGTSAKDAIKTVKQELNKYKINKYHREMYKK